VLCGSLYCDVSRIAEPEYVSFGTPWTDSSGCLTETGDIVCVTGEYITFYSGPQRTDPGFAPNGAACGTGKVAPV